MLGVQACDELKLSSNRDGVREEMCESWAGLDSREFGNCGIIELSQALVSRTLLLS